MQTQQTQKFQTRNYNPNLKLKHKKCGLSVVDLEWDKNSSIEAMNKEMMRLNKDHRLHLREKMEERASQDEGYAKAVKFQEAEDLKRELQQSTSRLTATYNRLPRNIKDKIKDKWELAEQLLLFKEQKQNAHTNSNYDQSNLKNITKKANENTGKDTSKKTDDKKDKEHDN